MYLDIGVKIPPMHVVYDKVNVVIITQQGQLLMVHGSGMHHIGTPPTRITTKLFLLSQQHQQVTSQHPVSLETRCSTTVCPVGIPVLGL